jgi:hypothetical protein
MTRAQEYNHLADQVRNRARTAGSRNLAVGWENLADYYALLAKLAEQNEKTDQVASTDEERPHN